MSLQVMMGQLAEGMFITVQIFVLTLLFSLPLGLLALAECLKIFCCAALLKFTYRLCAARR